MGQSFTQFFLGKLDHAEGPDSFPGSTRTGRKRHYDYLPYTTLHPHDYKHTCIQFSSSLYVLLTFDAFDHLRVRAKYPTIVS